MIQKRFISFLSICLLLAASLNSLAQNTKDELFQAMEGYWQGAFIKNNSYQKLDVKFYGNQNQISSLQIIEEWHPQFGEFVLPVEIDSSNQIIFNTGLGKAIMQLDSNALEMNGLIEGKLPSIYLHLKKVPYPPKKEFVLEELNIKSGDVELYGHLHIPSSKSKSALIIVGGRGCYAGETQFDLYAKLLRSYGVSVLVYNKRGTGKSTGDCNSASLTDLANDVLACKEYLEKHANNFTSIGVLGSSAGGWVMLKAEEKAKFDFLIGIVGPATTVKEQQLQSMDYGFDFYKLSPKAKSELMEYTHMMFEAKATASNFAKFKQLLKSSKENGWFELLDDTDIPQSKEDIDNLWVRRHDYDPKETLKGIQKPYLAIYGEVDWIVPYRENVSKLQEYFPVEQRKWLNIIIAHDAGHGTEAKAKEVSLKDGQSFWRFFRISPSVQIEIIEFLAKYNFIETDS